jgi:hypothetical protein
MRPVLVTDAVKEMKYIAKNLSEHSVSYKLIARDEDILECEKLSTGEVLIMSSLLARTFANEESCPGKLTRRTHIFTTGRAVSRRILRNMVRVFGNENVEFVVSLEDESIRDSVPSGLLEISEWVYRKRGALPEWLQSLIIAISQRELERFGRRQREDVIRTDDYLDRILAFSGRTI